jgi:hypothetical protein
VKYAPQATLDETVANSATASQIAAILPIMATFFVGCPVAPKNPLPCLAVASQVFPKVSIMR